MNSEEQVVCELCLEPGYVSPCPDCMFDMEQMEQTGPITHTKRKCKGCSSPLLSSRYFYCNSCQEELPLEGPFGDVTHTQRSHINPPSKVYTDYRMPEEKQCSNCMEIKHKSAFGRRYIKGAAMLTPHCKKCKNQTDKNRTAAYRAKIGPVRRLPVGADK